MGELFHKNYKVVNSGDGYEVTKDGQFIQSGMGSLALDRLIAVQKEHDFSDIYFSKIGMCGCGRPEEVQGFIKQFLTNQGENRDYKKNIALIKSTDPDIIFEFIAHVLDRADLLGHGGSVYGSWLTDEGKEFIELLGDHSDPDDI